MAKIILDDRASGSRVTVPNQNSGGLSTTFTGAEPGFCLRRNLKMEKVLSFGDVNFMMS